MTHEFTKVFSPVPIIKAVYKLWLSCWIGRYF